MTVTGNSLFTVEGGITTTSLNCLDESSGTSRTLDVTAGSFLATQSARSFLLLLLLLHVSPFYQFTKKKTVGINLCLCLLEFRGWVFSEPVNVAGNINANNLQATDTVTSTVGTTILTGNSTFITGMLSAADSLEVENAASLYSLTCTSTGCPTRLTNVTEVTGVASIGGDLTAINVLFTGATIEVLRGDATLSNVRISNGTLFVIDNGNLYTDACVLNGTIESLNGTIHSTGDGDTLGDLSSSGHEIRLSGNAVARSINTVGPVVLENQAVVLFNVTSSSQVSLSGQAAVLSYVTSSGPISLNDQAVVVWGIIGTGELGTVALDGTSSCDSINSQSAVTIGYVIFPSSPHSHHHPLIFSRSNSQ